MNKAIAGTVAGVIMAGIAVTGCGASNNYSGYDYVYDTHSHRYVYVQDSYYHSHRSLYSGTPRHVTNNYVNNHHITVVNPSTPKAAKVTKTPLHKKVGNAVQTAVAKHKPGRCRRRGCRR